MSPDLKARLNAYENIPEELQQLNQWLTFSIQDGKKIPHIAGEDKLASSTNASTWRSFEQAVQDVIKGKREHIGFAFAAENNLVFIDLDDIEDPDQQRIVKRFKTYSQISVSGEGRHIIGKGTFEGTGKHPAYPSVGLFKSSRLCLMTGNGSGVLSELPTADLQAVHDWLAKGKKDSTHQNLTDLVSTIPDQTVFELGCERFKKYRDLANGSWEKYDEYHNNHSEADHAFLGMLCDLTESNAQVRELFAMSGMWTDERAAKKAGHGFENYVNRTIQKIRSNQAREEMLMKSVTLNWAEIATKSVVDTSGLGSRHKIDAMPEGRLKRVAEWHWLQSYYPLQEASISTALGMAAVVSGRCYQTHTKKGLNPWIILVGITGSGKSEYQNGLNRLFAAVSAHRPHTNYQKMLMGPMASGEGLEDALGKRNRINSYFPEFHETFHNLVDPHGAPAHRSLKYQLLDLHGQSAKGSFLKRRNKARAKDHVEEEAVEAPCLTVSGETTPGELYGKMNTRDIDNGFLQRFIVLNVEHASISRRPNPNVGMPMPEDLLDDLADMFAKCELMCSENEFYYSKITKEARSILENFQNARRDENLDSEQGEGMSQIGNRGPLKVFQIATLLAVWANPDNPVVKSSDALWAMKFIQQSDDELILKFKTGEVGSGQVKQESEVLKAARSFAKLTVAERRKKGMVKKVAEELTMLPMLTLKDVVINNASFATDKYGAVSAFDKCIESLIKSGQITKVEKNYAVDEFDHLHGILLVIH